MHVENDFLFRDDGTRVPFEETPNVSPGTIVPKYLIMHYTAGTTADSAVNWFKNPNASASAHLVIDRDGSVTQMVRFNRKAWHAGRSRWQGIVGLNAHSVGIEMVNAGVLTHQGDVWKTWTGQTIPDEQVAVAAHKHESSPRGWQTYTPEQIESALAAAVALHRRYGFADILGHEDISPGRKTDPGPLFPLAGFRSKVLGRSDDEAPDADFVTTTDLNIRRGPGTHHDKLPASPLPPNTRVRLRDQVGVWFHVDVLDAVGGDNDIEGWVHSRYLERVA